MTKENQTAGAKGVFTVAGTTAVIIGIVVGTGIFRLPPLVAANTTGELQFLLFWVAGGVVSLMGALCYAELSTTLPNAGGEYHFLRKAFGPAAGFFFSWGRMTVIQTGSIAIVAYILGDYMTGVYPLGAYSSSLYAALTVIVLTGINITGTIYSQRTQNILVLLITSSILLLSIAALAKPMANTSVPGLFSHGGGSLLTGGAPGMAMIFVLLTFGGWNEAAYLTGEMHNVRKNIVRSLVTGIAAITLLYLLINIAYLKVLGFERLQQSDTVGYALAEALLGQRGAVIIVAVIIVSALSTANATIITGARTNYAMGRDYNLFERMGRWHQRRNAPVGALVVQGAIALALIIAGAWSKQGITTMVDYTAPVFWGFFFLITLSLFIIRKKYPKKEGRFKTPLYPIPPLIFLITCGYMLYSSITYTGAGALYGIAVLACGVPVWFLSQKAATRSQKSS
jgi:basic amino acid/polyamine antiporter, APA family